MYMVVQYMHIISFNPYNNLIIIIPIYRWSLFIQIRKKWSIESLIITLLVNGPVRSWTQRVWLLVYVLNHYHTALLQYIVFWPPPFCIIFSWSMFYIAMVYSFFNAVWYFILWIYCNLSILLPVVFGLFSGLCVLLLTLLHWTFSYL